MELSENVSTCSKCQKHYSTEGNLRKHVKEKHGGDTTLIHRKYKKSENFAFNCNCGKNFSHRRHFLNHLKTHSEPQPQNEPNTIDNSLSYPKKCPMCSYMDKFTKNLIEHFQKRHDIVIKIQTLEFFSSDTFNTWKLETERNTNSSFVKKYTNSSANGLCTFFLCNRSGNYVEKISERQRSLKTQGTNKIDAYCPASIKMLVNDDNITVKYIETHIGHVNELGHLFLNNSERTEIATKIAMKIPFETILDQVRDSVANSTLHRIHLLTKKDLFNIENSFNLQSEAIRHANDCLSVEAWVNEFKSKEDMHIFYKPQDTINTEFPQFRSEDFILIIMNQTQCDILLKFGTDTVCIDGTHGMKNCNFELITLLVLDDLRQGFPCAFCISSRTDKDAIKVLFSCVEQWCNKILPNVFMSDMADSFFNAWIEVMGMPKLRLYCTWHVDRAWRKNLSKIPNKEKQILVYKKLRTLLEERDQSAFLRILNAFCRELTDDSDTKEFGTYFIDHYGKHYEFWAYCYRLHSGVNTNMHLERMHGVFKHIYLKGKTVRRLDKVISALMKFIKDKLFDRLIAVNKGKISSKLKDIRSRHKTSLTLDVNSLIPTDHGWTLKSSSAKNYEMYFINEIDSNCQCQLKCNYCNVCIHRYSCSCMDSAIKWVMCKHIHLVCRLKENTNIQQSISNDETSDNDNQLQIVINPNTETEAETEYLGAALSQNKIHPESERHINKEKESIRVDFLGTLEEAKTLPEIDILKKKVASLRPTLAAVRMAEGRNYITSASVSTTPHNKNIMPQRTCFKTKKKKNSVKKISKPTAVESQKLAAMLLLKK